MSAEGFELISCLHGCVLVYSKSQEGSKRYNPVKNEKVLMRLVFCGEEDTAGGLDTGHQGQC